MIAARSQQLNRNNQSGANGGLNTNNGLGLGSNGGLGLGLGNTGVSGRRSSILGSTYGNGGLGYGNGGYGYGSGGNGYGNGGYGYGGSGYGNGYGGYGNGRYVMAYVPGIGWVLVPIRALRRGMF
jgi:hypothetical protein